MDDFSRNPLFSAASAVRADMIQFLIDKGAEVDSRCFGGCTALHAASASCRMPLPAPTFLSAHSLVVQERLFTRAASTEKKSARNGNSFDDWTQNGRKSKDLDL